MRLIDAGAIKTVDYSGLAYILPSDYEGIADYFYKQLVLNQPTAYDVDKVVEQLEKERDLSLKSAGKYYHKPLVRAHYQNAISIVKGGGQCE